MLQMFWLANPGMWIPDDGFNQIEDPKGDFPIGRNPMPKIIDELWLEDRVTGRRMALASLRSVEPQFATQRFDCLWPFRPCHRSPECPKQALSVLRGTQEMSRLLDTRQLVRCNQGDALSAPASDNHRVPILGGTVEQLGEIGTSLCVRRLHLHLSPSTCTDRLPCTTVQYMSNHKLSRGCSALDMPYTFPVRAEMALIILQAREGIPIIEHYSVWTELP